MKISYEQMIEIIGATENVGLADAWLNGFSDLFFEMTNYFSSYKRSGKKNDLNIHIECGDANGLATIFINEGLSRLTFSNKQQDYFSLELSTPRESFSFYGKLCHQNYIKAPYVFYENDSFTIPSKVIFNKHNMNYDSYHKSTSMNIEYVVDFNLFLIEKFKQIKTVSKYDCILPCYTNKLNRMFIIDSLDITVFIDHLKNKIHIKNSELKEFVDYQKYLELKAFQ